MNGDKSSTLSRRHFLARAGAAGAVGAAAWLAPRRLFGGTLIPREWLLTEDGPVQLIRRSANTDPVQVQKIRGSLHVLSGSGGNVAVLPGKDGVLLVDSGIVGAKIAAAVATFSTMPIRHVINTHWHFDHTDANEYHHAHGARILAHEKTRARLSADTRVEDWQFTFPRSPDGALPDDVFRDRHQVTVNGERIALRRYEPAHTDTDASVHFTDGNVLHVGDTWWNGMYPFIDYSTGGSIDGMIGANRRNIGSVSSSTVIVPGHGDVSDVAALRRHEDMLVAIRDRVAALKKQGRSSDDVVAAKPTKRFDDVYGKSIIGPDFFTRLVYKGV